MKVGGKPYWVIARDFVGKNNGKIIVSAIVLKELIHILGNKFSEK